MSGSKGTAWIVFDYGEALTISRALYAFDQQIQQCGCKVCEVQYLRIGELARQLTEFFTAVATQPEYFTGGFHEASSRAHPEGSPSEVG